MRTKKSYTFAIINFTLFILFITTLIILAISQDSRGMNLNSNKLATFNDGWTVSYNNKTNEDVTLPKDLNLAPGETYTIERKITRADFIYPVLRIRSSMMNINAYIDNVQIFKFTVEPNNTWFHTPYPASWQLIDIPVEKSIDKTLKITFSSPTNEFSGLLNSIIIGAGEALIINILKSNALNLLIAMLLIFLSILAFVTIFATRKLGISKHIIYLSSFGIASGFWIISESTLLQILIPNSFIIASASYILNLVLPLIIILLCRDVVLDGFKKITTTIAYLLISLIFIEIILQLTGVASFIGMTVYSIIAILIASFTIIGLLIFEGFKKNNPKAKKYLLILLFLFVFALIIMVLFLFGVYQNLGKFLSIGVFTFFLLVLGDAIYKINNLMEARNKSLIYKKLAYEDYLTKGGNRASFDQDIEALINQNKAFRLVLLDLNHLKKINDTYGHTEGDFAIIESFNALKTALGDNGKSYRISGDEFACIIYDTNEELFEYLKSKVITYLKEKSEKSPYNIILAFGTEVYNQKETFTSFYKKVDIEMYNNKKKIKASPLYN